MRVSIVTVLLACAVLPAVAAEEGVSRPVGKPEPAPQVRAPLSGLKPGRSCGAGEFEVCLDSSGRISVPGAKRFLPEVPGLKPERLTVKRSGVVLSYSF